MATKLRSTKSNIAPIKTDVIPGTVSGMFWHRFCEQLDILYIYEENEIDSKKNPEILNMSEEVLTKVTNYIQYNVLEESKINPNILKFFEVLNFKSLKLVELDITSREFKRLKVLDLSNNKIEVLENTPPNLEELYLNSNLVSSIRGPLNSSLLHLGLSYNKIDEYLLEEILRFYPNLFSLNISHNNLINLDEILQTLGQFQGLKVLVTMGNPCVLVEGYKPYSIHKLPNLRLFDNTPIAKDEAKRKGMKSERHTTGMGEVVLNNDVSYDLEVSVLGGVMGVKLTEEEFEDPTVFEGLEAQDKSSRFWIETEFLEERIKSEVKLWDTEFQKEEESGKTDFKLSLRRILQLLESSQHEQVEVIEAKSETKEDPVENREETKETPEGENQNEGEGEEKNVKAPEVRIQFSNSVYNSLLDGLWIELYEEYPVLSEVETEEGEKVNRVTLIDGKPRFKTAIRGVTRINTENWLLNPNLNSTDLIIHNKFYFYKLKYKTDPCFFYENHSTKLKLSEIEAIDSYVKSKREKMAQKEAEEKEKAAAEKANEKKDPKKDKGKKADDKNAIVVEIEDPEDIEYVKDYTIIEKSYKQNVPVEEQGEFPIQGKLEKANKKTGDDKKNAAKEVTQEDRMRAKQKKVMKDYDIILSLKSWLTVKLAMNQPEPVVPTEEEAEEPEPVGKGGKGKKK